MRLSITEAIPELADDDGRPHVPDKSDMAENDYERAQETTQFSVNAGLRSDDLGPSALRSDDRHRLVDNPGKPPLNYDYREQSSSQNPHPIPAGSSYGAERGYSARHSTPQKKEPRSISRQVSFTRQPHVDLDDNDERERDRGRGQDRERHWYREYDRREEVVRNKEEEIRRMEVEAKRKEEHVARNAEKVKKMEARVMKKEADAKRKEDEVRIKEEDVKRKEERVKEEAKRKAEDFSRKEEEAKQKEENLEKKAHKINIKIKEMENILRQREEELARREGVNFWREGGIQAREEEISRMEEEVKRKEDDAMRKVEEAKMMQAVVMKRESDMKRKEEEIRIQEEDAKRKEKEARLKEEEARRKADEMSRKEEEARQRKAQLEQDAEKMHLETHNIAEDLKKKEEGAHKKDIEMKERENILRRREEELMRREADNIRREEEANKNERAKQEEARKREELKEEFGDETRKEKARQEEAMKREEATKAAEAKRKEDNKKRRLQENEAMRKADEAAKRRELELRLENFRREQEENLLQNESQHTDDIDDMYLESLDPALVDPKLMDEQIKVLQQAEHRKKKEDIRRTREERKRNGNLSNDSAWSNPSFPPSNSPGTYESPLSRLHSRADEAGPSTWGPSIKPTTAAASSPDKAERTRKQQEFAESQQERFRRAQENMEAERLLKSVCRPLSREDSELQRVFELHEGLWTRLRLNTLYELSWNDFPWPMARQPSNPDDMSMSQIDAYIQSPLFPDMDKSRTPKDRIKEHIKRWHPDRFETKLLPKVVEDEREKVKLGAGKVARYLGDLLRKENERNNYNIFGD